MLFSLLLQHLPSCVFPTQTSQYFCSFAYQLVTYPAHQILIINWKLLNLFKVFTYILTHKICTHIQVINIAAANIRVKNKTRFITLHGKNALNSQFRCRYDAIQTHFDTRTDDLANTACPICYTRLV